MSALKGDLGKLAKLQQVLRDTPREIGEDVAKRGAPALTAELQGTYDAKQNVYGGANPNGADGQQLTLRKTGATDAVLQFSAAGATLRTAPFTRYTKFLIGKYRLLPIGRSPIPERWRARLQDLVRNYKPPVL